MFSEENILKIYPTNCTISVVVPIFNEGRRIEGNLELLLDEVRSIGSDFEIICVSDGSTDETNQFLKSFVHPQVKHLIFQKNQGKGFSIREGFKSCRGDFIFFIDGGMEIHPKELRIFLGLMELYEADIIVGSKRHPQSDVNYPWYRRILSWCYQQLVRCLFGVNVTDTQVGIKLFKKEVILATIDQLEIDRYGFDLELLFLAAQKGYSKVLEAPITLRYYSKQNSFFKDLLHVFCVGRILLLETIKLRLRLSKISMSKR